MDPGAGVVTGDPVHPARLTMLMSRIVITTAKSDDIVPRSFSEAITIAMRTRVQGSPGCGKPAGLVP